MKSPKSNSSQGLVSYILDRTNSFDSTYNALKNVLLGSSKIKTTYIGSENREIQITTGSIFENISPIVSGDINTVKVWPTFKIGGYYPVSNDISEYDNLSLGGNYSLIKLNTEVNEKYHHITIESSTINPIVFIVLDSTFNDGAIFEFKVTFTKLLDGLSPIVVFLDGTYCDIKTSKNGKYIKIDGIDYEYVDSGNVTYNLSKYNNKEIISSLTKNEALLVSVEDKKQITNKIYGKSHKVELENLNVVNYDNYGLFDSEYIKTYQNDSLTLVCLSLLDPSRLDDLVVSYGVDSIKYSATNGQMYLVGIDDNRIPYSAYNAMSFGQKLSREHSKTHLLNNYPNQLALKTKNTGNKSVAISFNAEYVNNPDSVIVHTIGLPKTNKLCVIRKSINALEVYVEGNDIHNISNSSTSLKILVGFYDKLNSTYIRVQIKDNSGILFDIFEKTSDEEILNYNLPYTQTALTHSISNVVSVYSVEISEYVVTTELNELIINGIFGSTESFDYDNNNILMSRKIIPVHGLEGFLATINKNTKSTMSTKVDDAQNIDEISYRVSLIYNKQKGDFLYIPNKKYTLNESNSYVGLKYSGNYSKTCRLDRNNIITKTVYKKNNLNVNCVSDIPTFDARRTFIYNGDYYDGINVYPKMITVATSENNVALNCSVGDTVNAYNVVKQLDVSSLKVDFSINLRVYLDSKVKNNTYTLYYVDNRTSTFKLIKIKDIIVDDTNKVRLDKKQYNPTSGTGKYVEEKYTDSSNNVTYVYKFNGTVISKTTFDNSINLSTEYVSSNILTLHINDTSTNIDLFNNINVLDESNNTKPYGNNIMYGGFVLLHKIDSGYSDSSWSFYTNDSILHIDTTLNIHEEYNTVETVQEIIDYSHSVNDSIIFNRCNKVLKYSDVYSWVSKKYELETPESTANYRNGYIKLNGNSSYSYCIFISNNTSVVVDSKIHDEMNLPIGSTVDLSEYNKLQDEVIEVTMWQGFEADIAITNARLMSGKKIALYVDFGDNSYRASTMTLSNKHLFYGANYMYDGGYKMSEEIDYTNISKYKYYLNNVEITKQEFESSVNTSWKSKASGEFIRINCEYSYYKGSIPFGNTISENTGIDNFNGKIITYDKLACERVNLTRGSISNGTFIVGVDDPTLFQFAVVTKFKNKFAYYVQYRNNEVTGQTSEWVDDGSVKVKPVITTTEILNTKINYLTIKSEYINTYQDNKINSSGWKVFGYYQLPINI